VRHFCKIHEGERYVYLHISTYFEQEEIDAVHNYGLWDHLFADVTPDSFREQYEEAKNFEQRLDQLHAEYESLPFFGYDLDKDEIKNEIAELQQHFTGIPTHNDNWLVRPARLIENPLVEIPFTTYAEVQKAERDISRALTAFARKLQELIPEPTLEPPPEPEPIPEPTTPEIDERDLYFHTLLIAQSRWGKTNAICWRLESILPHIARGEASAIVMEPKGVLIDDLLHLADVWEMRDRVVIIDPTDTPVAVNLFDKGDGSQRAINDTIGRIESILGIITLGLTSFQRDALTFAIRAMFTIDGPVNLDTLKGILRRGITALPAARLPKGLRDFFENDFKPSDGSATQLIARLNGLIANPVFEALFSGEGASFDIMDAIQAGRLIVINVNSGALGRGQAVELYGRFWIEQVCKTIYPRLDLLKHGRVKPTLFIIDEAQTYVKEDLRLAEILDTAAEAKIGMFMAVHHMGQITEPRVRDSMYTNCILKFAARTSADIHNLSRSMGDVDFLGTLKRYEFAYFGPNLEKSIKVKFPLVEFNHMPKMANEQYYELRRMSRDRYGYTPEAEEQEQSEPDPQPEDPKPVRRTKWGKKE
jgi:hypothetical protein